VNPRIRESENRDGAPLQMRHTTGCPAEIGAGSRQRARSAWLDSEQMRSYEVLLTARADADSRHGSAARLRVADRHEVAHGDRELMSDDVIRCSSDQVRARV
jgi:hypothetical protein